MRRAWMALILISVVVASFISDAHVGLETRSSVLWADEPVHALAAASSCALPATDLCIDWEQTQNLHWSRPIVWMFNPLGGPTDAVGSIGAVRSAMDAWVNEAGSPAVEAAYPGDHSSIEFVFGGLTVAGLAGPVLDGLNTIAFPLTWQFDAGALAVTTCTYQTSSGDILECDVSVNRNLPWGVDGGASTYDFQSALTHEAGHIAGLAHVIAPADKELSMFPTATLGETKKRTLGAGEVLALRALYPE